MYQKLKRLDFDKENLLREMIINLTFTFHFLYFYCERFLSIQKRNQRAFIFKPFNLRINEFLTLKANVKSYRQLFQITDNVKVV